MVAIKQCIINLTLLYYLFSFIVMDHLHELLTRYNSSLPIHLDLQCSFVFSGETIRQIIEAKRHNPKLKNYMKCISRSVNQPLPNCLQHLNLTQFNFTNMGLHRPIYEFSSVSYWFQAWILIFKWTRIWIYFYLRSMISKDAQAEPSLSLESKIFNYKFTNSSFII